MEGEYHDKAYQDSRSLGPGHATSYASIGVKVDYLASCRPGMHFACAEFR